MKNRVTLPAIYRKDMDICLPVTNEASATLKRLLRKHNKSQVALSSFINLSEAQVSRMLNGKNGYKKMIDGVEKEGTRDLSIRDLVAILRFIDASAEERYEVYDKMGVGYLRYIDFLGAGMILSDINKNLAQDGYPVVHYNS